MSKEFLYNSFSTLKLEFKALEDQSAGQFTGYVAAFDNIDRTGDILKKSATQNLDYQKKYPLLFSHNMDRPIGGFNIEVDDFGIKMVDGFLDIENNQDARMAYSLMQKGVIDSFSIGYQTKKASFAKVENKDVRILEDIDLLEGSVVTCPANPKAKINSLKSYETQNQQKIYINRIKLMNEIFKLYNNN